MWRWLCEALHWPVQATAHASSRAPEIELLRSQQEWINRRLLELDAAVQRRRYERHD